ncbi:phosphoribosylglycinamide formyltransferase [Hazenella sp. IB182357]|uniref:Phosphoribosylglycinamide formyltransferase n=1 Tax=Polycladospora coralii TaxID=2771432 RepID=A0A926NB73_9BACL|nr:phosphoribosylglycinamide formyltransferase [Polycladospora coralii]MBD1373357.1 phosphoribosylglycinamide formyltransferase [Polycladospora coralii]
MSIAVFASGSGSNFKNIVLRSRVEAWGRAVRLLICDQPNAKVLQLAQELQVTAYLIEPSSYPSKKAYEKAILEILQEHGIEWVILAGYMRLVGTTLLQAFPKRIVNIHPSLLPAFPGLNAIEKAFLHPVKVTGVTIHFVDEGMDTGPILAQVPVSISEIDTLETLVDKIHQAEHNLYPTIIKQLIETETKWRRKEH